MCLTCFVVFVIFILSFFMGEYDQSPFKNGYWVWNKHMHCVQFESRELPKVSSEAAVRTTKKHKRTPKGAPTCDLKFRDNIDNLEQIRFKRFFQRQCKPDEPEVITLQDIKDIVLFTANPKDLSTDFIFMFHSRIMDRFLRAMIVFFQFYIQTWEKMMLRREEKKRKLYQPEVTIMENLVRDDLADLRSLVSREYCSLLCGLEEAAAFHADVQQEKGRRLYEILIGFTIRVVWTALHRKYLGLIDLELNRMLRSDTFNVVMHRPKRSTAFERTPGEARVLKGASDFPESKLIQRSCVAKELIYGDHDHRMFAFGVTQFEQKDDRMEYMEAAFTAPEAQLLDLNIRIGLLGIPRKEYDAMLLQREKTSKTYNKPIQEASEFKIPTKTRHSFSSIPQFFPKTPPVYTESPQNLRARLNQRNLWLRKLKERHRKTNF